MGTAIACLAAGAVLAACGSSSSSSSAPASSGAIAASSGGSGRNSGGSSSTTPSGQTSASSASSASGQVGPGRCYSNQLSVHPGQSSGAAGSVSRIVTFTNTSSSTCTLTGYPGMQMLGSSGQRLATTVHRGAAATVPALAVRTVTVAPGGTASFVAGWADATGYAGETCPTSSRVEITAPNDYSSLTIAWAIAPYGGNTTNLHCGDISVSPVYAGSGQPPA